MMKNCILTILTGCFIFAMSLSAQVISQDSSLSLDHDTVTEHGFYDTSWVEVKSVLRNISGQDQTIKWRRIVNDLTSGWASSVCVAGNCYLETVSTKTFDLSNGDSVTFDIRFYPDNKPGSGVAHVLAFTEGRDSAATVVGVVFNGFAEKSVGLLDRVHVNKNENIKIYPNPVKDFILIRNLPEYQRTTVEVYNIFGKRMLYFSNPPSSSNAQIQKFDVESLAKGIYMIRIYDAFMNVIYTKSISKVNN